MPRIHHRRAGMTLVELLVVVAIIGILAVTVLPNLSNTAESRRTRETARAVSTWVSKAQSRAIGRTEWAGFWIIPVNTAAPYAAAIDVQLADVPEVYRGESLQSQVFVRAPINPPGNLANWTDFYRELHLPNASVQQAPYLTDIALQANFRSIQTGDLIRFDGCGCWYELFQYTTTPQVAFGVRFRQISPSPPSPELHVQNPLNTAWPLEGVPHSYEILRRPVHSGATYSFADGRCIDLYWSGQQTSTGYAPFSASGATAMPVAILFDATGRVRELFHRGTRMAVEGTIYLLVGRADRAGQALASLNANDDSVGANWQYADSYWIAIDPSSGIAKVAEVATGASNITADVAGSQAFIRYSQITTGGR